MTISESAQLVIKAGAVGKTSEIMVLDMGNEVNINSLAKDFIRLSGNDPDQIKIKYTGLRPGEKLKEELVGYYEGTNSTKHKKILVIESKEFSASSLLNTFEELQQLSTKFDKIAFKDKLFEEVKKINGLEKSISVKV